MSEIIEENQNQNIEISLFEGKIQENKKTKCKEIILRIKEFLFNKKNIIYILYIISVICYFISLIGCHSSFQECQDLAKTNYYEILAIFLIISCLLFALCLILLFTSNLNKINCILFLSIFTIIFIFSQGTDFASHGTYNFLAFIGLLPFLLGVYGFLYKLGYYCYNKERKKWLFILIIILLIILLLGYKTKCIHFYEGLGNEFIYNDPLSDSCEFILPSHCGLDIFSGLFDLSALFKDCKDKNDNKETFLKYIDKNLSKYDKFYYPRTEYWPQNNTYFSLVEFIEKTITIDDIYNSNGTNNDKEIAINFKNGKGSVEINIKKNESLIKERRKIAELNPVKYDNIYVLYVDAISRNHFRRKLKKTSNIIENMLYKKNDKDEKYKNFNAFQFFKYYNFEGHTRGNNMPFIYGNGEYASTGISITKFFREKGFITGVTHNSCNKELFDWEPDFYKDFEFSNWDHENIGLFCDTNYEDKIDKWAIIKGKCSIIRKCFYGKDSFEYNFEYGYKFLEAYKNERKYFKLMISDGHEITLEVIKYIDDSLSKFLLNIINNYKNDKTAIMIMSDHGAQMPSLYDILFYEERFMEKYMGALFLIFYGNNSNYDNIYYNQQKLMTTYDLHDTLLDMINVNKYLFPQMNTQKGQSLFYKINGMERNCDTYKLDSISNCYCKKYKK